jgi:hypothetical protein
MTTSLVQLHCASLRSKSAYAAFGDFHEEHADLMGATTTYWCLKTMGKAGPDDHYVHRSICQEGRSCWESCEQAEES